MRTTSLISLALLVGALAPVASAQTATFDSQSENFCSSLMLDGGLLFFELDTGFPGPPIWSFCIEDASADLAGFPHFTSPNTLGFNGWTPGPSAGFSACKSFKILPAQASSTASIELYVLDSSPGNALTLEAWSSGSMVAASTLTFLGGSVVRHYTLAVSAPAFDELHVVGSGPTDGGVFLGVIDTVVVSDQPPGTSFCAGDGSGAACPCGNASTVGADEGCLNSFGQGARLRAIGTSSIANDTLVLLGSQMPSAPVLYFQGTSPSAGGAGLVFGDGLRCAAGTVVRLATKTNVAGTSQYPGAGEPSVSERGQVTVPGTRYYQGWYRNSAAFCTPAPFNLTNGWQINWTL